MTSSFHPRVGGVEEHTARVAAELSRRGHQVEVWAVDRGDGLLTATVDGVPARYLPCPQPARSVGGVLRFLRAAPGAALAWRKAYRSLRPEILHVQCFGPNGVYSLALHRLTGTPLVVSSHGETFADDHRVFDRSRLQQGALRSALEQAGAVTGCSRLVTDDLRSRFGFERSRVVPNGVVIDEPADPGWAAPEGPTFVAVGRLEHTKGFDLLLEAFATEGLPTRAWLLIGGDGAEATALRDRAGALGIADRVAFPGRLSRGQVVAAMASAAAVVVPSRTEAFGITTLEGWRSGRPVIATNHGGPAEIVRDGLDGFLVDPLDLPALARAMAGVLDDPAEAERVGRAGRERVGDFTWGKVADLYEDIYRRVLAST